MPDLLQCLPRNTKSSFCPLTEWALGFAAMAQIRLNLALRPSLAPLVVRASWLALRARIENAVEHARSLG